MPIIQQLVRPRRIQIKKKTKSPALQNCPQRHPLKKQNEDVVNWLRTYGLVWTPSQLTCGNNRSGTGKANSQRGPFFTKVKAMKGYPCRRLDLPQGMSAVKRVPKGTQYLY